MQEKGTFIAFKMLKILTVQKGMKFFINIAPDPLSEVIYNHRE
mgnify:CR=1|jgi:hypothetical protein